MIKYAIKSLRFSGGQEFAVEANALLILIGPNNCGKSRALRDIAGQLNRPRGSSNEGLVVLGIEVMNEGTEEDLRVWLDDSYPVIHVGRDKAWAYYTSSGETRTIQTSSLASIVTPHSWDKAIAPFLVHELATADRLTLGNPARSIAVFTDPHQHYIHSLQVDAAREAEISEEVQAAFGKALLIDWGGGARVGFRLGDEPPRTRRNDRVSPTYQRALKQLSRLEEEGDGIRSYVGCVLAVKCGAHKVLLIDEPEAFLHPPQARRIGRLLAESAKSLGRQVIIATHSADVVQGAIGSTGRVAVCRINRVEDKNNAHMLKSDEIRDLWSKPLLKSSGAVAGIFHSGVVVCEGDADCRFYEGLLLRLDSNGAFDRPADLHFVHGGGKGQLASLARSYVRLKVPVAAIADFDILRNRNELKKLVEALDGDFSNVERLYTSVSSALADLSPSVTPKKLVSGMRDIADVIEEHEGLSTEHKKTIESLINDSADWSEAKKHGINKLSGGANTDCRDLLDWLKDRGLYVVEEGALESWDRSLPRQKAKWIHEALNKMHDKPNSFDAASKFVRKVGGHLGLK
jgi:energy-coupling factor transporter ATP-binding protein EcfA2